MNIFKKFLKYTSEKDLIELNIFLDPIVILLIFLFFFNGLFENIKFLFLYSLGFCLLINYFFSSIGLYSSYKYKSLYNLANKIFTGWTSTFSIFITLNIFLIENYAFDNLKLFFWYILSGLYLAIHHLIYRKIVREITVKGFNRKKVIFYGKYSDINKFNLLINRNKWIGDEVVAYFIDDFNKDYPHQININYLGGLKEMKLFLENNQLDQIYFSHDSSYSASIDVLLDIFGNTSLRVIFIPTWSSGGMILKPVQLGNDKLAIEIWGVERSYINLFKKRMFDFTLALIMLILFIPIFIIIGILIKSTSKGPIFFKQYRSGLNGKKFLIYKFRTMYEKYCDGNTVQAKFNDIRVTKVGKFIRKWSIDELPQLINVIKGEMSLVGPRPHAVEHNQIYRKMIRGYMQRHASIPGLTGLAQIMGLRGETTDISKMEARIKSDLKYHSQWSIFLDIKILIKTIINIRSDSAF